MQEVYLLKSIYDEMEIILEQILEKFPDKWDETVYNALFDNVLNFYFKIGVSFEDVVINDVQKVRVNVV